MRTITNAVHILVDDTTAKRKRNKLARQIESVIVAGIASGAIKVGDGVTAAVKVEATPRLSLD